MTPDETRTAARWTRRQRPADRQPGCRGAQPRFPRRVAARLRLHARRRWSPIPMPAIRRRTYSLPTRRRDESLLPHQLVSRQAVRARLQRGRGQFPDEQFRQRRGCGGDAVRAEAQDFGGTNNANFCDTSRRPAAAPMQMYIFPGPTPDRDGSLDPDIVLHELTHGVSNRLIGNGNGLNWDVGGGMGEGWSDFYALSLQHNTRGRRPERQVRLRRLHDLPAMAASRTITSTASAAFRTRPTTRSIRSPGATSTTSPPATRAASRRARSISRAERRRRGAQRRRDLGGDAVGSAQPDHRRQRQQRAGRQRQDAAARHRRAEDDADQSELAAGARRDPRRRLRDQCLRQRGFDLGRVLRSRPRLRGNRAARAIGRLWLRRVHRHQGVIPVAAHRRAERRGERQPRQ